MGRLWSYGYLWQPSLNTGYHLLDSCVKMRVAFSWLYFNNFISILNHSSSPSMFLNWSVNPRIPPLDNSSSTKTSSLTSVTDWLMNPSLSVWNEESDPFREVNWWCKRHPQTEEPLGSSGLIRFVLQRSAALSTSNIYGSHVRKTDIWDLSESWLTWILLMLHCSPNRCYTHTHTP